MKKTVYSLVAFAAAAFAFTACSDVPTPEGYNPNTGDGLITYVPEGTGVATDPYNVAGIIDATKDLANGTSTTAEIYCKGYIAEIDASQEFNPTYGNITYYITDNEAGNSKKFYVYRSLGLGEQKFTSKDDIKVGDAVTICGKVKNHNGVFEYDQGCYLVELNGKKAAGGGGGGGEAGEEVFSAAFTTDQAGFTIDDKSLSGGLTYIWKYDINKYMKASGYFNNACNVAESWLISPAFSLAGATAPVLTFNNACNKVNTGTITDYIKVKVSTDGTNWTDVTMANMPSGSSWTFVDSTVDLAAYKGQANVKVAFVYISTTAIAPTWEIKTVKVTK